MAHPLDGARARLRRGHQHLVALQEQVAAYSQRPDVQGVGATREYDARRQRIVVRISRLPEVPEDWLLIAGDAVHNFRAALDHLVWELRFIDSGGVELVNDRTQFPIVTRAKELNRVTRARWLPDISDRHFAHIKRYQPYRGWKEPGYVHPLRLLDNFSNDDKHRMVHVGYSAVVRLSIEAGRQTRDCVVDESRLNSLPRRRSAGSPLNLNAILHTIPVIPTGPKPDMEVECEGSVYVAFGNGVPLKEGLQDAEALVTKIVEDFAPEFDTPAARHVWRPRRSRMDRMRQPRGLGGNGMTWGKVTS